jgi:hypothetical protein
MSEINQTTTDTESTEVTPTLSVKTKKSKGVLIIVAFVVLVGAFFALQKFGVIDGKATDDGGIVVKDPETIVATVNGVDVTRGELDKKIEQVKRTLPEGAVDPTEDAAFELQLLNDLISLKLLTLIAVEKNYIVTDEQIESERTTLIEQLGGEETFNKQLEALSITNEELRENMKNELLIRQLLDDETDIDTITVSDEEIATAYEMAIGGAEASSTEELPTLEQVSEMLRSEITNQKSASIIQTYLDTVRATADIEITLE